MAHGCNLNARGAEAAKSPRVRGQPGLEYEPHTHSQTRPPTHLPGDVFPRSPVSVAASRGSPAVSRGERPRRVLRRLAANGLGAREGERASTTEAGGRKRGQARLRPGVGGRRPGSGRIAKEPGGPALSVEISRKPRRSLKTKSAQARRPGPGILLRHQPPPGLATPRTHSRTHARRLARSLALSRSLSLRPRAPFPPLSSSPGLREPLSARCIVGIEVEPAAVAARGARRGRDRAENAGVAAREESTGPPPPQ